LDREIPATGFKTTLMNFRTIINRLIVLSFYIAAGYLLARSFYYGSFIGIVLALVAIFAWTYFLHQLNKMSQKQQDPDAMEELHG